MPIPKIIHYCWFGGNPKPKLALKCIKSWQKKCPDYKIVEWNESNFDVNCNLYCKQEVKNLLKNKFMDSLQTLKEIISMYRYIKN